MLTHVWHLLVNLSTLRSSEYDLLSGKVASLVGCYMPSRAVITNNLNALDCADGEEERQT
jgi:hypothetical protein